MIPLKLTYDHSAQSYVMKLLSCEYAFFLRRCWDRLDATIKCANMVSIFYFKPSQNISFSLLKVCVVDIFIGLCEYFVWCVSQFVTICYGQIGVVCLSICLTWFSCEKTHTHRQALETSEPKMLLFLLFTRWMLLFFVFISFIWKRLILCQHSFCRSLYVFPPFRFALSLEFLRNFEYHQKTNRNDSLWSLLAHLFCFQTTREHLYGNVFLVGCIFY